MGNVDLDHETYGAGRIEGHQQQSPELGSQGGPLSGSSQRLKMVSPLHNTTRILYISMCVCLLVNIFYTLLPNSQDFASRKRTLEIHCLLWFAVSTKGTVMVGATGDPSGVWCLGSLEKNSVTQFGCGSPLEGQSPLILLRGVYLFSSPCLGFSLKPKVRLVVLA